VDSEISKDRIEELKALRTKLMTYNSAINTKSGSESWVIKEVPFYYADVNSEDRKNEQ